MIRDYLDIDRHWGILAYYDVMQDDFSQLGPILREFGCPEHEIEKAYDTIRQTNKAFVFSAPWARMSVMAKILIMLLMYFGRAGVLTISVGFLKRKPAGEKYRYAHTSLLIG